MMRRFVTAFAATAVVALFACSDDEDSEPVTPATVGAFASALCAKTAACFGDTTMRVLYGNVDTCAARQRQQLELDVKGQGSTVTDGAARTCIDKINAASCENILVGVLPSECNFKGTLPDGAACTGNGQCSSGSCFVADQGSCGKCGAPVPLDGDCSQGRCEQGLDCNTDKKCKRPGAAGVACDEATPCGPSLSCVNRTCTASLGEGAPCTVGDLMAVPCDLTKGLICQRPGDIGVDGTCGRVDFARSGEACPLSGNPRRFVLCENGECSGLQDGTCQGWLADGAPCGEDTAGCQQPARCRNGRCALLDPTTCK